MEKALIILVLATILTPLAAASTDAYGINGSEPKFLKGIGPQDERIDNPLAATIVAVGVALVILRGLHRYTQEG